MADSLRVPTIGRIVEELDGTYPGTSMYEAVTALTKWRRTAKKRWRDKHHNSHLLFEGEGEGFKATYHVGKRIRKSNVCDEFDNDFYFSHISNLRIQYDDSVFNYPKMVIETSNPVGNAFGASAIRIFAVYGPDESAIVWGRGSEGTCTGSMRYIQEQVELGHPTQNFNSAALVEMKSGQLFLARMALELATNWRLGRLVDPLPTVVATSITFAEVINQQWKQPTD